MSIIPINLGLLEGFQGIKSDQADTARRQRRNEALEAGFGAIEKIGVAFVDRLTKENRRQEYDDAMEQGPEALNELLASRANEGDDDARQLLAHFQRGEKNAADTARTDRKFAADQDYRAKSLANQERGLKVQEGRAELSAAETRRKAEAEEDTMLDRSRVASDYERALPPNASPQMRALAGAHAQAIREGKVPSATSMSGVLGIGGTSATGVAAPKAMTGPQLNAKVMTEQRAVTQKAQADNRRAADDIFRVAADPKAPDGAAQTAATLAATIVNDTLNRPKPDGTPWSSGDVLTLYDDLPNAPQTMKLQLLARAKHLADQRDEKVAAAMPAITAAAADPAALAVVGVQYGLTPDDVLDARRRPGTAAFWENSTVFQPGDKHYSAWRAGEYIQFLHPMGHVEFWPRPKARAMGYEGP